MLSVPITLPKIVEIYLYQVIEARFLVDQSKNTKIIKSNNEIISSTVYNILGKKVLSAKKAKKLDVNNLSSGVYTIHISDGTNQTIQKFIKL